MVCVMKLILKCFLPLMPLLLPLYGYARNVQEPFLYAAPVRMPKVLPEMNTPGFWISKHPHPDKLIMDKSQIARFNERVHNQGSFTRIEKHSPIYQGEMVKSQLQSMLSTLAAKGKYDAQGLKVSHATLDSIRRNCNLNQIPRQIKVRFGFPTRFARQCYAPALLNWNQKLLDVEFNELINSGYDIGTPTVFYHDSADGKWVFGASATSVGWYLKDEVAFYPQSKWKAYQENAKRVICTKARSDLWQNAEATRFLGWCRMGTSFPLIGSTKDYYRILVPYPDSLGSAYLAKEDAVDNYLPFTPRNVYKQAFKMLNMPYGWADSDGDYDCSSMIRHVFSVFGIKLPRNGFTQVKTARTLHAFKGQNEQQREQTLIQKGIPGLSMLRLDGHIMLYLGAHAGRAYAIHDTWGFRKPGEKREDDIYVINRVVVSDLYLGQGSERGSLLKRLTHMGWF